MVISATRIREICLSFLLVPQQVKYLKDSLDHSILVPNIVGYEVVMLINEICERPAILIQKLITIWEDSVRATHFFLSDGERARIKAFLPEAIISVPFLLTASEEGELVGFMGIDGKRLEMLFIKNSWRGKGVGRKLLAFAMQRHGVNELTVNEQNPGAIGFYKHLGFKPYKRTERDEQGAPYPLLYMKIETEGI